MKKIRDDDRAVMRSNGAVKEGDNAIGKKAVRMVEFAHGMDIPVIYHPHGNYCSSGLMDPILSTGIDGFQFAEENDPSRICELIGDRCVIMGGHGHSADSLLRDRKGDMLRDGETSQGMFRKQIHLQLFMFASERHPH